MEGLVGGRWEGGGWVVEQAEDVRCGAVRDFVRNNIDTLIASDSLERRRSGQRCSLKGICAGGRNSQLRCFAYRNPIWNTSWLAGGRLAMSHPKV